MVRGRPWTVRLEAGYANRTGNVGLCERWRKTIIIDRDQPRENQEITLIHEILHAIWPSRILSDRTEEKVINSLDAALYDVLKNNKI